MVWSRQLLTPKMLLNTASQHANYCHSLLGDLLWAPRPTHAGT